MSEALPPRHFWRRGFALLVDVILVSALSLAMVWPFVGRGDRIRLSGGIFEITACKPITRIAPELAALIGVPPEVEGQLCETRPYGIRQGYTAHIVIPGHESIRRVVSVNLGADGRTVNPVQPQDSLSLILLLAGSAWFLRRWQGQTPGKRLLGLRLIPTDAAPNWWRRECRRLGPILLQAALVLLGALFIDKIQPFALRHLGMAFAIQAGFGLWLIWYYVLPLLRWRGQMRYDRAVGLHLTRA